MNEYQRLSLLMDTFKTQEDINEVVKTLSTAELKRYIHILESAKGK
jgi:hypothetical protein